MSHDWWNIFRHSSDDVPISPNAIRDSINSDGTLQVEEIASVPEDAIIWNRVAFKKDGTALYIVST